MQASVFPLSHIAHSVCENLSLALDVRVGKYVLARYGTALRVKGWNRFFQVVPAVLVEIVCV